MLADLDSELQRSTTLQGKTDFGNSMPVYPPQQYLANIPNFMKADTDNVPPETSLYS